MAKLDSPFGSKRVSGRIGDGFVMSSWRGIPYLRQRVIPTYRTSERLERVRGLFAQQNRRWMELRESEREAWRMFCERRHLRMRSLPPIPPWPWMWGFLSRSSRPNRRRPCLLI
jgi:hypothetical protein